MGQRGREKRFVFLYVYTGALLGWGLACLVLLVTGILVVSLHDQTTGR